MKEQKDRAWECQHGGTEKQLWDNKRFSEKQMKAIITMLKTAGSADETQESLAENGILRTKNL